jgi:hypothetical protein
VDARHKAGHDEFRGKPQLERDEMGLMAAPEGPRMHRATLDLVFSDGARHHFYFAWGCFRNFRVWLSDAWRHGEAIQLQAIRLLPE